MRRRLVLAIAGAVAATVLVVGVGTVLLARIDARNETEEELSRRTGELAAVVGDLRPERARSAARRLGPALDADAVLLFTVADPPDWMGTDDLARLQAGDVVSSRRGDTIYAAAPIVRGRQPVRRGVEAIDTAEADLGSAGRWFLIAGAVTVGLGVLVAIWVARSLAGPLVAAEATTRRMAGGDLGARVPDRGGHDELARLTRSINDLAVSLERSQRAEREFLLSISHDLRTPLTSIGGWAEALTDGTAVDAAAAGHTILTEAGRLDRLVRDLLDLARLNADAFTLHLVPVDLRDIATSTAEGLRPEVEDLGLTIDAVVPAESVMVNGDADRLAQVAGNLVENAGRHAVHDIRVSVFVDGHDAVLAVDDDGSGIPVDERPRVFERLHADLRPAARPGSGTGLGLAIVRQLARAMGGDVHAGGSDHGGARLTVRLPLGDTGHTAHE